MDGTRLLQQLHPSTSFRENASTSSHKPLQLQRDLLVQEAIEQDAGLQAQTARIRALVTQSSAASSLPAPMSKTTIWQAPLYSPFIVDDGTMFMLELEQAFPPGRDAESRAMLAEAKSQFFMLSARERDVIHETELMFIEYNESIAMKNVIKDHIILIDQLLALARARLSTGGTSLSEFENIQLERSRMMARLSTVEGQSKRSLVTLCAALRRPISFETIPGTPEPLEVSNLSLNALLDLAKSKRTELQSAEAMIEREKAIAEMTNAHANTPEFAVGLNYGLSPQSEMANTWGASFSMSLPWLSPGPQAATNAAQLTTQASRMDATLMLTEVTKNVVDSYEKLQSSAKRLSILESSSIPTTQNVINAVAASFATGGSDTLLWITSIRTRLDVIMEKIEVEHELRRALSDLDRAVGTRIARRPFHAKDFIDDKH